MNDNEVPDLVGLDLYDATITAAESGYQIRVTRVDDIGRIITHDYVSTRINLEFENDIVVKQSIG